VGSDQGFTDAIPPVGKLFRDNQGTNVQGHCSGTLFTVRYVITAAHCLYSNGEMSSETGYTGYNITHEHLWFAADESFGSDQGSDISSAQAPYRFLKIVHSWVPQCWVDGDMGCDYGVAEVEPYSDGSYVGSYTGTFPLVWQYGVYSGQQFYLYGYPASNAFALSQYGYGDSPYYCRDSYDSYIIYPGGTATGLSAANCKMTGGASGGPVFTQLSDGHWYVAGVNNWGNRYNTTGSIGNSEEYLAWNYWRSSNFGAFLCGNFPVCG